MSMHEISADGITYAICLPHAETDYIQMKLASSGEPYELPMLQDMASRLQPNDLVLDVGANIGNHTLYLSNVSRCIVHAFEPNVILCEGLNESICANSLQERITVHQVGASDAAGHAVFDHLNESNLGGQSLAIRANDAEAPIKLIRLDDLKFDRPVRMIKIDVEGMEVNVLDGACGIIRADKPVIYIEAQDFAEFEKQKHRLQELGYFYQETFNATPTHLFLHETQLASAIELSQCLSDRQNQAYFMAEQKRKLDDANIKYRNVSRQVAELKSLNERYSDRLESNAALESKYLELLKNNSTLEVKHSELIKNNEALEFKCSELLKKNSALEIESSEILKNNDALESKHSELLRNNEALESKLDLHKNHNQEISTAVNKLSSQVSEARLKYRNSSKQIIQLKLMLERKDNRCVELYEKTNSLNKKLAAIKSSNTWKAGLQFRKASSSIIDAIKLPARLYRIAKSQHIQNPKNKLHDIQKLNSTELNTQPVEKQQLEPSVLNTQLHDNDLGNIPIAKPGFNTRSLVYKSNCDIRIACIMDEFTFGSYQYEAQLTQLTPEYWQQELEACQPELLFIESAWRGKDELWGNKVGHCSAEIKSILAWCNSKGIPTIFWNKEDPVHFETFLTTAKHFDFVFTTDLDCIQRYKAALGHNRVYFLPFACQPQVHNPIEKYQRKDAFCFAGAYYVRYPDRTRDLENFAEELPGFKPLEIYDRNHGKDNPDYQFPGKYQPYIVGTLRFDEIDKAYKGYKYAINLNSIKQSQSMFARRVYELLGSNTLTVSNFSRGLRLMFGDLVLASDSGIEIKSKLHALQEQGGIDRLRLAGLRKVMSEHTYADRFNYVLEKITGEARGNNLPGIFIIAPATNVQEIQRQLVSIKCQQGVKLKAALVVDKSLLKTARQLLQELPLHMNVQVISEQDLQQKNLQELASEKCWAALMHPLDHYGANYLLDMLLATRYSKSNIIGKGSWYSFQQGVLHVNEVGRVYQQAYNLVARRSIIAPQNAADTQVSNLLADIDNFTYTQPEQFSVDCYNYCMGMPDQQVDLKAKVDDFPFNQGCRLEQLLKDSESIEPKSGNAEGQVSISGEQLAQCLMGKAASILREVDDLSASGTNKTVQLTRNKDISTQVVGNALHVKSDLKDGQHEYIYSPKAFSIESLWAELGCEFSNTLDIHFSTDPGLNLNLVVLYLDVKGNRVGHQMVLPNRNGQLVVPEGASKLKLGLRVYAGGSADIKSLVFGHLVLEPESIQGQSDVLLLTNHYPSYDDLYRNGFVHTRVRAYAEQGVKVDVFRLRKNEPISWHEFQGADVTTASQDALRKILKSGRYRHVLVHFLDPDMWEVLKDFLSDIRVTVWVHGAEVQPWWRREYNYQENSQELETAKIESEKRLAFWFGIMQSVPDNLKFVFVSRYFADEVMQDVGVVLGGECYEIIHNPIDTDIFNYLPKPVEHRLKVLSIRPYASRKYANDLSVKAVLELSREPFFNDLEFKFVGDGVLFEETLAPLKNFSNVIIERGFLSQQEIADLHKGYGVFLCPTRMDAQGVSKDEAMASGLVVVSNAVTAIPEFIDDECGVLAAGEDYQGMAEGMKRIMLNPDLYSDISKKASSRVRKQTGKSIVIEKEISLIMR